MIIKKILPFVLLTFIISCSNSYTEEEETNLKTSVEKTYTEISNKTNLAPKATKQKFIHRVEKKHQFSYPGKNDLFQISLAGKNIINADIEFKIISYNNKTIYQQKFKGLDLIGFGSNNGMPMTNKQQEDYIIKRMNEFFNEKNFSKPAIKSNELVDTGIISKQIWNEIKANKNSIGFYYLLGKEDGRYITFYKKTGKVLLYRNCC